MCDVNGKMFNVIFNMYKNAKSCVSKDGFLSDYFRCSVGVRQGENLSPLLFAIFLTKWSKMTNVLVSLDIFLNITLLTHMVGRY